MNLTDEQQKLHDAALDFARAELSAELVERDRQAIFHRELWRKCAEFGVLGMPAPQEYGGMGRSLTDLLAVMEGLGRGTRDHGLLFSLNAHLWTNTLPILRFGNETQKRRFVPGLCDGTLIGANGASEPEAGSDIFSLRTRAVRDGNHYVLDGAKTFVTNAPVADLFVVYATVDPQLGVSGITAFIIPRETPGMSVGRPIQKMGLRTSPMAEVVFENCRVPLLQRLGREGRGAEVFQCSMEWERGCILASCLGAMQRQLDECVAHARSRRQFGKPIGKFQSVANRLVNMRVRIDTCRPLVYRIGELKDTGKDAPIEAAIAKLYVSEAYVASCVDAIQVFGGYGYVAEQQIERDLRDSIAGTIYSGTSDIQRNIIAKGLGL